MAKVLLVEDDNNLREIFEMRLQAEGYEAMSAADGEEGLVVAMKQKPDLIIADVMMPKLSGFEMLETLRATPEMNDVKVIMMTALGQAEDRARGEKLGVVKYLVKSQVTLEDFVRVVREVLAPDGKKDSSSPDNEQAQPTNNQESEKSMQDDNTTNNVAPAPGSDASTPPANPMGNSGGDASGTGQMSTADEQANVQDQINNFASAPAPDAAAAGSDPAMASDPAAAGTPDPAAGSSDDTAAPTAPTEGPQPPADEPKPDESPMPGAPPMPPAA